MTNYNDNQWHAWNGGDCPVHPESQIDITWPGGELLYGIPAKKQCWHASSFLFRVTKEYREAREFWVVGMAAFAAVDRALACAQEHEIIHVREVIEEEGDT